MEFWHEDKNDLKTDLEQDTNAIQKKKYPKVSFVMNNIPYIFW